MIASTHITSNWETKKTFSANGVGFIADVAGGIVNSCDIWKHWVYIWSMYGYIFCNMV